jgi:hypothetical protein
MIELPPLAVHLEHLLWRALRFSVGWMGTSILALAVGIVRYFVPPWLDKRRKSDHLPSETPQHRLATSLKLTAAVWMVLYACAIVAVIYQDHEGLAEANKKLSAQAADLNAELLLRKHTIITADPVFWNVSYLLQSFEAFRNSLKGQPCTVKITAPADSRAFASLIAQLSNSVSGCSTLGPMDANTDPDVGLETMDGMIPGLVVFHAPKDDAPANQLFGNLGSQIRLQRSYAPSHDYHVPSDGSTHEIWLQFGTGSKWISQEHAP